MTYVRKSLPGQPVPLPNGAMGMFTVIRDPDADGVLQVTPCPFCAAAVEDLGAHYGSDDCPKLVLACGGLTAAGRARELRLFTHDAFGSPKPERDTAAARPVKLKPSTGGRCARMFCPECGARATRKGHCEQHYQQAQALSRKRYYDANRESLLTKARAKHAARRVARAEL